MKVTAPGKIILSGEHAVVYGAPAIGMAVNRFVETLITESNEPGINFSKNSELASHTTMEFLNRYNLTLEQGLNIETESIIPIGCGLGSSAALITSLLKALHQYFKIEISDKDFLKFATDIEDLVHGTSSGLDIHVCAMGGAIKYQNGQCEKITLPEFPFTIVNTGIPESSTKECVEYVSSNFKNKTLLNAFAKATELFTNDIEQAVAEKHKLLDQLGVVPNKVNQFIKEVGMPAKICGAGSIKGSAAGMLLVLGNQDLSSICETYDYSIMPVHIENKGVL